MPGLLRADPAFSFEKWHLLTEYTLSIPDAETTVVPSRSRLSTWDMVSLIIAIVIGTGIFKTPPMVFSAAGSATAGLIAWGLGAVLVFSGALCYSELAVTYPASGAEYAYLSKAFGRWLGFLFAWMQFTVILTGNIGTMAFVFGDYAMALLPPLDSYAILIPCGAVLASMAAHLFGARTGTTLQNILTVAKILALGLILVAGMVAVSPDTISTSAVQEETLPAASTTESMSPQTEQENADDESTPSSAFGLALVFVLFTYGGWNDVTTVTPEVHNHQRNVPRAFLIGLAIIAAFYLLMNLAYLNALGYEGLCASSAPAADVMSQTFGPNWSVLMSLIVMLSSFGAIHGMLFSACRMLTDVGREHRLFRRWGVWNQNGVPTAALCSLATVSLILIFSVGTQTGQEMISTAVNRVGLQAPNWEQYGGGFDTLLAATAPVFWTFFALSGLSVIVLRVRDGNRDRPFKVPLYPVTPIVFIGTSLYMLWSSLNYAGGLTLLALPIILIGLVLSQTERSSKTITDSTTSVS